MKEEEIAAIALRMQIDAMEQVIRLGGKFNPVTKMWMSTCMIAGVIGLLNQGGDPDTFCVEAVVAGPDKDRPGYIMLDYEFSGDAPTCGCKA